jgi:hypothetical protein
MVKSLYQDIDAKGFAVCTQVIITRRKGASKKLSKNFNINRRE